MTQQHLPTFMLGSLAWFSLFFSGCTQPPVSSSATTPDRSPLASPMPAKPAADFTVSSTSSSGINSSSTGVDSVKVEAGTPARSQPQPSRAIPSGQPTPNKPNSSTPPKQASTSKPKPPTLSRPLVPTLDAVLEIRVAIAEGAESVPFRTSTPARVFGPDGKVVRELAPQQPYQIHADGQTLYIDSWKIPAGGWLEPTPGGYFSIRDRWYRGRLLLFAGDSRLLAVNSVLLRSYLSSVVGGEVSPSWPMNALKAQAIAARSYALTYYFNPATPFYHLGDTESYQVYFGVEKEADTTRQAVEATAGEYISYKGGVVESLYAATDDIVDIVHGGRGMSQLGALKLAEEGQDYRQILNTYYPGTKVARIAMEHE